jgi:hypothetical protein
MTVEAVNSVLQATPVVRASVEQASAAATSGNPASVQKVALAPFISPYLTVDVTTNTPVFQIRDSDTGKVLDQIPSQLRVRTQIEESLVQQQAAPAPQPQAQPIAVSAPAPQQNNTPITAQQIAAFTAAAQSGNTNAGNVSLFA